MRDTLMIAATALLTVGCSGLRIESAQWLPGLQDVESQDATTPETADPQVESKVSWLNASTFDAQTTGNASHRLTLRIDKGAKVSVGANTHTVSEVRSLQIGLIRVDAGNNPVQKRRTRKVDGETQTRVLTLNELFIPLNGSVETSYSTGKTDGVYGASVPLTALKTQQGIYAPAMRAKLRVDADGTPMDLEETVYYAQTTNRELVNTTRSWGDSVGRVSYGFLAGTIISSEPDQFDFSEVNLYLRLLADTTLEANEKEGEEEEALNFDADEVHIILDTQLTTVPVKAMDATNADFLSSKSAFVGSLGIDWRCLQYEPWDDYTLEFGPSVRVGFETLTEERSVAEQNANLSSVNDFWNIGVRFTGQAPSTGNRNPLPRHYGQFYYGDYDSLGNKRVAFDMGLILYPATGFFIGLNGNLGKGDDDVRLVFGFTTALSSLFNAIGNLTPAGLRQ